MVHTTNVALTATLIVTLLAQSVNAVKVKDTSSILMGESVNKVVGLPSGEYSDSCINCKVTSAGVLSCQCYNGIGQLNDYSFLQNSFACSGCIINDSGTLVCQLPSSADTWGYLSACSQCSVNFDSLSCVTCSGSTPFPIFGICSNPCIGGVAYIPSTNSFQCDTTAAPTGPVGTPAPTSPTLTPSVATNGPTAMPTNPTTTTPTFTKSPTPDLAPIDCGAYWVDINGNNVEKAPYKLCGDGEFTTTQGCQYQNYCCWQATSTTTGVCKVPPGVPVDCPSVTSQSACQNYPSACFWDATYAPSGLCRRLCPGDPTTMCVF